MARIRWAWTTLAVAALAACAGGPGGTSVSGTVLDFSGTPVEGVPVVWIGGAETTTDASGRFMLSQVKPPYDVIVTNVPENRATLYLGLTRSDPLLMFPGGSPAPVRTASVSGTVMGGAEYPELANQRTSVWFTPLEDEVVTADPAAGGYRIDAQWRGSSSVSGAIHALQREVDAGGRTMDYLGYGRLDDVVLADGDALVGRDIAMGSSVAEGSLSGSATVPAGFALTGVVMGVRFGGTETAILDTHPGPAAAFAFVTPDVDGVQVTLDARAEAGSYPFRRDVRMRRFGLDANAAGIAMELPEPPALVRPADAETGVGIGTEFAWSAMAGAVHGVTFWSPFVSDAPSFTIFTDTGVIGLPDLTPYGLTLPAATEYTWSVSAVAPFADVDDAASIGFWEALHDRPVDHTTGESEVRSFVTP